MNFQIKALPIAPFAPLFAMSDDELRRHGAVRRVVDSRPGFPCRVSLEDAEIGERVLLLNFEHQPADSPYRSRHAIFVREDAAEAHPAVGEVPELFRRRLLSVRAFDANGMMVEADVVDGQLLEFAITKMLANRAVAYLHLHNAKPGCYAARVDRA
jgi:Protein of unknown function (DUF1203)